MSMKELAMSEVEQVSGGISDDLVWGTAIATSVGFVVAAGALTVSAPVLAFAFASGSLVSSGIAIDMSFMSGGGNVDFLPDLTRRRG